MSRANIDDLKLKTNSFHGIYRGVIENNNDPEMLGRCRIRVWGIHDDNIDPDELEGIPTENLCWAEPCLGLIEGSVSGAGCFSIPLQGSHVFLFFEGGNWQSPRYFATVPGQPIDPPDTTKGFNDPAGEFPREDRLDEPDWHRLARTDTTTQWDKRPTFPDSHPENYDVNYDPETGTILDHKWKNLDMEVPMADGENWSEPEPAYEAQYPKNIVMTTHRGITIEIDNTLGNERLHIYHPSNTYIEIDAVGNVVFRNDANRFEITRGSRNKHVLVDDNETIDADKTSKVGNDEIIEIGHDREKAVKNNDRETIGKDRITTVGQNETVEIGRNRTSTVGIDETESIGSNRTTDIGTDDTTTIGENWTVTVTGNVNITCNGSATVKSDGPATVEGSVGILKATGGNTLTVS